MLHDLTLHSVLVLAFIAGSAEAQPTGWLVIGESLNQAETVEQMDAVAHQMDVGLIDLSNQLAETLRTTSSNEKRVRACYLLGVLGADSAASTIADYIDVDAGRVGDLSKIRQWRQHPCLEALMGMGKRGAGSLVAALMRGQPDPMRDEILRGLYWMQGEGTLALFDEAIERADPQQAVRLRAARERLDVVVKRVPTGPCPSTRDRGGL